MVPQSPCCVQGFGNRSYEQRGGLLAREKEEICFFGIRELCFLGENNLSQSSDVCSEKQRTGTKDYNVGKPCRNVVVCDRRDAICVTPDSLFLVPMRPESQNKPKGVETKVGRFFFKDTNRNRRSNIAVAAAAASSTTTSPRTSAIPYADLHDHHHLVHQFAVALLDVLGPGRLGQRTRKGVFWVYCSSQGFKPRESTGCVRNHCIPFDSGYRPTTRDYCDVSRRFTSRCVFFVS